MTPLRQFKGVPAEVVRKAEGKEFLSHVASLHMMMFQLDFQPWYRYFDLVNYIK